VAIPQAGLRMSSRLRFLGSNPRLWSPPEGPFPLNGPEGEPSTSWKAREGVDLIPLSGEMLHRLGMTIVLRIRLIRTRARERRVLDPADRFLQPEEQAEVQALVDLLEHLYDSSTTYPDHDGPMEDVFRAHFTDPQFR